LFVHADDLLLAAPQVDLGNLWAQLQTTMAVNIVSEVGSSWTPYLGRLWRRADGGFEVKMGESYYQDLLSQAGLSASRPVTSPAWGKQEDPDDHLSFAEMDVYRQLVGKLAWLLPVRPEISFRVKEAARHLSQPTATWMRRVKHVLRYFRGSTGAVLQLRRDLGQNFDLQVWSDASWGGESGRSTSGGLITLQGFVISTWSKTQPSISLSSCEAELLALSTAASEGLQVQAMINEVGFFSLSRLAI